MSDSHGPVDALVADIVRRCGYRFSLASDEGAREVAYRLRYQAIVQQGWATEIELADDRERDEFDDRAVHLLCWDDGVPVATGRLVLPPGELPTERICSIRVDPKGRVADVGRMAVAPSHQSHRHAVFMALLARLHLEVQKRGFAVACGVVSARAQSMMRLLGVRLEVLGEERLYWGELRAPVRFSFGTADPAASPPEDA